jgi:hypothetical protein
MGSAERRGGRLLTEDRAAGRPKRSYVSKLTVGRRHLEEQRRKQKECVADHACPSDAHSKPQAE